MREVRPDTLAWKSECQTELQALSEEPVLSSSFRNRTLGPMSVAQWEGPSCSLSQRGLVWVASQTGCLGSPRFHHTFLLGHPPSRLHYFSSFVAKYHVLFSFFITSYLFYFNSSFLYIKPRIFVFFFVVMLFCQCSDSFLVSIIYVTVCIIYV